MNIRTLILIVMATLVLCQSSISAPPTLTDYWDGKAVWNLNATAIGSNCAMHFVSMIDVGNEMWAYYIRYVNDADGMSHGTCGRARSTDGINFREEIGSGPCRIKNIVIGSWEKSSKPIVVEFQAFAFGKRNTLD